MITVEFSLSKDLPSCERWIQPRATADGVTLSALVSHPLLYGLAVPLTEYWGLNKVV